MNLTTLARTGAFLLASALAPAVQAQAQATGSIVIGASLPLSGANAAAGKEGLAVLQSYVDSVNRAGGIDGRPLQLTALDDGFNPQKAADNARELAAGKAVALVNCWGSSSCSTMVPVATQAGLPLVPRPYDLLAEQLGVSAELVKARLAAMLESGRIRRIGAVPNHYAIGYTANGMSVWDVDDAHIARLGETIGKLDFVTHCYERPRALPDWPYNLFAMVHGHDRATVLAHIDEIAALLGPDCRRHDVLFSTAILKKTGLRIGNDG